MKCSDACIDAIKAFEGLRLEAYRCPSGVPTIGYGHTNDVYMGMRIDEAKAEELLREDMQMTEQYVNIWYPNISQSRYDALVSLIYNIGADAYHKSTLKKRVDLNAPIAEVKKQWLRWVHSKGKVLPGLQKRREWEFAQYEKNK